MTGEHITFIRTPMSITSLTDRFKRLRRTCQYQWLLSRLKLSLRKKAGRRKYDMGIFIVSSGRSGSTLLRRILHSHPSISIPPESEDLILRFSAIYLRSNSSPDLLISELSQLISGLDCMHHWKLNFEHVQALWHDCLQRQAGFSEFYAAIYRAYAMENKPVATIHGDKTPLLIWYLELINILYPHALIIHLIRHPLDAISSAAKRRNATSSELLELADRWKMAAQLASRRSKNKWRHRTMLIKYEDLVMTPERVVIDVCNALGIDFIPSMVNDRKYDLGDTILSHHRNVSNPVNDASIGIWRERISQEQAAVVMDRCSQMAHELGYNDLMG